VPGAAGTAGESGAAGAGASGGCDLEEDFGEPFLVPFSEPGDRTDGRLTADEKTIYFHAGEGISKAIWSEENARFENETVVLDEKGPDEMTPSITDDGLELYYVLPGEPETNPNAGIHVSRRQRLEDPFQPGDFVQNISRRAGAPFIAPSGNTLYFVIDWTVQTATKTNGVFGSTEPVSILGNEEPSYAMLPSVSADEKTLLVGSYRKVEGKDVWLVIRATRENLGDPFSGAARIPSLVKANTENQPHWISRDGCRLYFHRKEGEHTKLWMASRPDLR
jgi:Tol biopolymer transport system component